MGIERKTVWKVKSGEFPTLDDALYAEANRIACAVVEDPVVDRCRALLDEWHGLRVKATALADERSLVEQAIASGGVKVRKGEVVRPAGEPLPAQVTHAPYQRPDLPAVFRWDPGPGPDGVINLDGASTKPACDWTIGVDVATKPTEPDYVGRAPVGEWQDHDGKGWPLCGMLDKIEIETRNGVVAPVGPAGRCRWGRLKESPFDIVRYRVVEVADDQ